MGLSCKTLITKESQVIRSTEHNELLKWNDICAGLYQDYSCSSTTCAI